MPFKAVTFDCYGTLIDWDGGIGAFLESWSARTKIRMPVEDALGLFADFQRAHQAARPFKPYRQVLHDAFLDLAAAVGAGGETGDADAFAGSVADWPAFADTVPTLKELKLRGLVVGVVSNVDAKSFAGTCERQLDGQIDVAVTADEVRAYKPDPAHFEAILARLGARGIAQHEVLHVAQSRFHDIAPASVIGLASVWTDRRAGRPGRGVSIACDAEPDARLTDLAALPAVIEQWGRGRAHA